MKKDKRKKTNEKILAFKVKTNIRAGTAAPVNFFEMAKEDRVSD